MKFLDRHLVGRGTFGLLSALVLPGLMAIGCVSLTKPENVERNCTPSSATSCSDDPSQHLPAAGEDAKKDIADNPDRPSNEDTPTVKPDAGPDVPAPVPDSSPDRADSATDNKDTGADGSDTSLLPADVPVEKVPVVEPGPEPPAAEPVPEPSSGPEPAKEPGPEPGPEPGKEPGPEPAPEPPPDGGSDTPAVSNCTIFFGSAPSTGSAGHPPATNSTEAFCVATCDDIVGWGCSNDGGRTYTVNGTTVACGATITKKNGYHVFQVSAGSNSSAAIYWWGTYATSCAAPPGGVFP